MNTLLRPRHYLLIAQRATTAATTTPLPTQHLCPRAVSAIGGRRCYSTSQGPAGTVKKANAEQTADQWFEEMDDEPVKERVPLSKEKMDAMLRVDHAGEYGAIRILQGQRDILKGTKDEPTIQEMLDQEMHHYQSFQKILPDNRVRPTAMLPVWHVLGYALGAGTALMGREAAMACTVAVEEVIADHYNDQLRHLVEEGDEKKKDLRDTIRQFRDEEIGHKETGLQNDAQQAPAYELLSAVIGTGCRAAIWVSSRV
eukprot:GFYU01008107.1.p1 GENE.GFYU01008107.1~~GFYU01008107.1.p1  ORF type:complete len:256 (+),score=58.24 GFYU01008107.1:50-817(+)